MATNLLGIRNSNAIVPYSSATKRSKQYTLTVTCPQTGWATEYAVGIASVYGTFVYTIK